MSRAAAPARRKPRRRAAPALAQAPSPLRRGIAALLTVLGGALRRIGTVWMYAIPFFINTDAGRYAAPGLVFIGGTVIPFLIFRAVGGSLSAAGAALIGAAAPATAGQTASPTRGAARAARAAPQAATAATDGLRGHAAMLLFAAVISVSFSLGDRAADLIAPEALNSLRFAIAAAVLGGAALALGPGLRRAHLAAPWRYPLLGGLLAVYFILMFVALRITDPVSTGAVFTLTPLMAALFGWLLLRQRTTPRMALALALGGAGAIWVIFKADLEALRALRIGRGEAIFFIGCAAHALYAPLVRRLNRGEPPLAFSFWTVLAGFVVISGVAAASGALRTTDWAALPPIVWLAALYLSLGATALTFFLLQFAALRLPSHLLRPS
ncbi:MAG: DMT family transporter, partial [Pseudomonadota bacterium]